MRVGRERLGTVLGALAVLALCTLTGTPAPGATAVAARPGSHADLADPGYSLTITATVPYGYQPDTIANVPLNATINVTFIDDTPLPHSFNISSREGVEIVDYVSTSAAQLNRTLFSAPALYAAYVGGQGDESVGAFRSPAAAGWYEFVCNVSGHFQLGMFGYIAFGEGLPSNLTLPGGTGGGGNRGFTPAFVIAGLAAVLVVLVSLRVRLGRIARERALEEEDTASVILPRPPPPP